MYTNVRCRKGYVYKFAEKGFVYKWYRKGYVYKLAQKKICIQIGTEKICIRKAQKGFVYKRCRKGYVYKLAQKRICIEIGTERICIQIVGLTIDDIFDYHDNSTITETTITILSLSWHTIMILSRYYHVSQQWSFNMAKSKKNELWTKQLVVVVCIICLI